MLITNDSGQTLNQVILPVPFNTSCSGTTVTCYRANPNFNKSQSNNKYYIIGYENVRVNGTNTLKIKILESCFFLKNLETIYFRINKSRFFKDLKQTFLFLQYPLQSFEHLMQFHEFVR